MINTFIDNDMIGFFINNKLIENVKVADRNDFSAKTHLEIAYVLAEPSSFDMRTNVTFQNQWRTSVVSLMGYRDRREGRATTTDIYQLNHYMWISIVCW